MPIACKRTAFGNITQSLVSASPQPSLTNIKQVTAVTTQPLSVDCEYLGDPRPQVSMTGDAIQGNLMSVTQLQNPPDSDCFLVAASRLEWDSGSTRYQRRGAGGTVTCQGENSLGTDTQDITIDVECKLLFCC